jgi:heme exporter protein D
MTDWLQLGGYGGFVWGSFGLALGIALVEPWLAWRRLRRARRALQEDRT